MIIVTYSKLKYKEELCEGCYGYTDTNDYTCIYKDSDELKEFLEYVDEQKDSEFTIIGIWEI